MNKKRQEEIERLSSATASEKEKEAFSVHARPIVWDLLTEIQRLKALVNLCIDNSQNWSQRAIDLGLLANEDIDFYNESMLAENNRLKAQYEGMQKSLQWDLDQRAAEIERLNILVNSWAPFMKTHGFLKED